MNTDLILANVSQILNTLLFILSGFFFGIFGSRESLFSIADIHLRLKERRFNITSVLFIFLRMLILLCAFLFFPGWFATRTLTGTFIYYTVLLFFFAKGWKKIYR